MKEYKSILLLVNSIQELGDVLNKYTRKGWYIKDTITNGSIYKDAFEFGYLLERNIKLFDVRYTIDDNVFNKNYFAYDFDDVKDKFMRDETLDIDARYEHASTSFNDN